MIPSNTKLEHKVADLGQQMQTATEKDTKAQATIDELQQQITLHQGTLTDTERENVMEQWNLLNNWRSH